MQYATRDDVLFIVEREVQQAAMRFVVNHNNQPRD